MASQEQFTAVVVAAGTARRFGGELPKQFRDLAGRRVVERSIEALAGRPGVRGVVLVLAADRLDDSLARALSGRADVLQVVAGGDTRARSVRNGLAAAPPGDHVLVHDAARPLVPAAVVDAVIRATRDDGAAVPVLPVPDTVKRVVGDRIRETVDRDGLRLAQTPQGSRGDWLRAALAEAESAGLSLTDEAAALEHAGRPVTPVAGDPDNFKITTPRDLERAARILGDREMDLRVGTGFDIHALDENRPLVLGGVAFPGEPGLAGHSDADVVLHAAMDALLGAVGLADIGAHFPPDDSRWAGADSADLMRRVAVMLREAGWRPVNLDLMLLAERPKVRDRVAEMRRTIAGCLGIEPDQVGLKATTLERLGALGRGEGIACQAVALVSRTAV